jgi:hypothetical protein
LIRRSAQPKGGMIKKYAIPALVSFSNIFNSSTQKGGADRHRPAYFLFSLTSASA